MTEELRVPLHMLRAWWGERQGETSESILADVDAQAEAQGLPAAVREAVLAAVRRILHHRHELQYAQLAAALDAEIERRLPRL